MTPMGDGDIAVALGCSSEEVAALIESALRKIRTALDIDSLPESWFRRESYWYDVDALDVDAMSARRRALTGVDVYAMRLARCRGVTASALSARFGITVASVNKIVGGRAWKDVPMPPVSERRVVARKRRRTWGTP